MTAFAGVDGCRGGWICVARTGSEHPSVRVFARFEAILDAMPDATIIAVDMPVGLPERCGRGGRGPESLVRPLLGARQSSVFSIPARAAVLAGAGPFPDSASYVEGHRRACAVARGLSDPPRGVSIQAFGLFPKIAELDALLLARPQLRRIVHESHPELAFWRLNGGAPMALPKKIKGVVNPAGMEERRALLARCGLPASLLRATPPRGAGADDLLDACAMLVTAARIADGAARPFPDPPLDDGRGIPLAIWA